jgi:hypothetical protein
MTWSPIRIEARDRRRVALHEAGHVAIARHVGIRASAAIFRHADADAMNEKTWSGQASFDMRTFNRRSIIRTTMVAVAGAIAEDADSRDSDPDLFDWYEPDIMSESDWRFAYCAPGEPNPTLFRAARRVHDLLHGELRADLYAIARQLIRDAK